MAPTRVANGLEQRSPWHGLDNISGNTVLPRRVCFLVYAIFVWAQGVKRRNHEHSCGRAWRLFSVLLGERCQSVAAPVDVGQTRPNAQEKHASGLEDTTCVRAAGETRTPDLGITNASLYQLSYSG